MLNSQDKKSLEKSLRILKPAGKVISISGPPDVDFAKQINVNWFLKMVMKFLSAGIKKKAKRLGVNFSFLFMRSEGEQLTQISFTDTPGNQLRILRTKIKNENFLMHQD